MKGTAHKAKEVGNNALQYNTDLVTFVERNHLGKAPRQLQNLHLERQRLPDALEHELAMPLGDQRRLASRLRAVRAPW